MSDIEKEWRDKLAQVPADDPLALRKYDRELMLKLLGRMCALAHEVERLRTRVDVIGCGD